GNSPEILR
ncbi:hypothetical protein KPH14_012891, partial [Odynerus spinipes]